MAFAFFLLWNVLAVVFLTLTYKSPRVGFSLAVFFILTVIRILGINNLFISATPILLSFFTSNNFIFLYRLSKYRLSKCHSFRGKSEVSLRNSHPT